MNPFEELKLDPADTRWQDLAICSRTKNINPKFFDRYYQNNPHLRPMVDEICLGCPVIKECLTAAVEDKESFVWGGTYFENGRPVPEFNDHKTDEFRQRLAERFNE